MLRKTLKKKEAVLPLVLLFTAALVVFAPACAPVNKNAPVIAKEQPNTTGRSTEPVIEAAPVTVNNEWQVINGDSVTITVTAPAAQSIEILYRPAFAEGRHVVLKKIPSPTDASAGRFSTELKVPSDFAGDVWAEAFYAQGEKKQTKPISLTVESVSAAELADASYKHSDESARSDRVTGGHIEQTPFQPGQPDIRITVNIPAFQLTLWQNGKEIKTYEIGIGKSEFPLPDGLRHATQIVFNPDWVPPDSSWVEEHDVVPGERVEADDPRNPLGKLKIPIGGGGILIHQAFHPSDLGHLVSHGCVRVQLNELYDLVDKIIAARSLKVSKQQLDHAKRTKDRFAIKLDAPLIVDITYDTEVVEGGILHLYPDVYNHHRNTVEKIREELQSVGLDSSALEDETLRQMLARVNRNEQFVVSLADIKSGGALAAGQNQPLTSQSVKKSAPKATKSTKRRR